MASPYPIWESATIPVESASYSLRRPRVSKGKTVYEVLSKNYRSLIGHHIVLSAFKSHLLRGIRIINRIFRTHQPT